MITKKCQERRAFLEKDVIEYYLQNEDTTLRELEKIFKCSRYTIANILKEKGLLVRNRYHDVKLKYAFEEINSEEAAYWLGFIYADGSITYTPDKKCIRYVLEIGLKKDDNLHLEKFKAFIGTHCIVKYRKKTNSCRLIVSSKELVTNLYKLGILKNKTYINNIENIWSKVPMQFKRDFIRGYFDGDGHISKNNILSFTSYFSESVIFLLENILQEPIFRVYNKEKTEAKSVRLLKRESTFMMHYMYKNSNIFLDRKFKKYEIAVLNGNI